MTLQVGDHFTARWLNTPAAVRSTYIDDLKRICNLLEPDTELTQWQTANKIAQVQSQQQIEHTYAELTAQCIEAAKVREQQRLEQSLVAQREQEKYEIQQLENDEIKRQTQQNSRFEQFKTELLSNTEQQLKRQTKSSSKSSTKKQQAIENMNIILELEAEQLTSKLQQVVAEFTQNLHQATQDEIKISLTQMTQATQAKNT